MNQFSFFVPVRLVKSGSGSPTEPIRIGGRISTDDRDSDGETLLSAGLDFSYFDQGYGKIKYEHDTEINKEPDNIIGFPTELKKGKSHVDFEGELIEFRGIPDDLLTPQQKAAKGAHGLIKAIEDYNRTHPEIKQSAGWSIEGEYIDRDPKTGVVKKARITNVVLTTKPKNTKTYAEFAKSLEVGYATETTDKTGWGATQRESIDRKFKNKEKSEMTEQQYYNSCLEKGMSEEEAKKATEKWKAEEAEKSNKTNMKKSEDNDLDDDEEEMKSELDEVEKSLNNLIGQTIKLDIGSTKQAMQKSITVGKDEEPDMYEIFGNQNAAHVATLQQNDLLNSKIDVLAKSLSVVAGALNSILKSGAIVRKSVKLNNAASAKLFKAIGYKSGLSTDLIDGVKVDDTTGSGSEPTFQEKRKAIDELFNENKIEKSVVIRFESAGGFMDENTKRLVKSKVNEIRKA